MLIRRFIELLTPEQCVGCEAPGVVICATCRLQNGLGKALACYRCNRLSAGGATCEDCCRLTPLAGVTVAAFYGGPVKTLILGLKFHRLQSAAGAAAEMVTAVLPPGLHFDMVTSVPVSAERYRERGYNQSELVARRVAADLDLPYLVMLGRHERVHQLGLDRRTRLEQVKGAFYPSKRLPGGRVLLVDDVVTTGATMAECAGVLIAAGADSVWGAAVARH